MEIFLWLLGGFLIGLVVGWLLFGRRSADAEAGVAAVRADVDRLKAERDALATELDACKAARKALEAQGAPVVGLASMPPVHDDLRRILGVGKENEARLRAAGITSFAQIASWTDADVKRVETMLAFDGRIERERWIEQAKLLAAGNMEEFTRRFPTAGSRTNT